MKEMPSQFEIDAAHRILTNDGPTVGELKRAVRFRPLVLGLLYIGRAMEATFAPLKGIPSSQFAFPGFIEVAKEHFDNPHLIVRQNARNTLMRAEMSLRE